MGSVKSGSRGSAGSTEWRELRERDRDSLAERSDSAECERARSRNTQLRMSWTRASSWLIIILMGKACETPTTEAEFIEPTFGASGARDRAQPIRQVMAICNTQCKELTLPRADWDTRIKEIVGLAFPNLPFFIDGKLQLSTPVPIMKHLLSEGRRELLGKSSLERNLIDQVLAVVNRQTIRLFDLLEHAHPKEHSYE